MFCLVVFIKQLDQNCMKEIMFLETEILSDYQSAILRWTGSRDRSVGIATSYGLDGPGIESRWRRDFPHPSRHGVAQWCCRRKVYFQGLHGIFFLQFGFVMIEGS